MISKQEILKNAKGIENENVKGGKNVISFSVTNNQNGKRVTLSQGLYKCLGCPEELKFSVNEEAKVVVCSEDLPNITKSFKVSGKSKGIIYNAALVESITSAMNIDFSGCTSTTFRDIEFEKIDDINVAFIQFWLQILPQGFKNLAAVRRIIW